MKKSELLIVNGGGYTYYEDHESFADHTDPEEVLFPTGFGNTQPNPLVSNMEYDEEEDYLGEEEVLLPTQYNRIKR